MISVRTSVASNTMQKKISSMAIEVIIRNSCSRISIVIYSFFQVRFSFDKWC